jgi:hypothetical protein
MKLHAPTHFYTAIKRRSKKRTTKPGDCGTSIGLDKCVAPTQDGFGGCHFGDVERIPDSPTCQCVRIHARDD